MRDVRALLESRPYLKSYAVYGKISKFVISTITIPESDG